MTYLKIGLAWTEKLKLMETMEALPPVVSQPLIVLFPSFSVGGFEMGLWLSLDSDSDFVGLKVHQASKSESLHC